MTSTATFVVALASNLYNSTCLNGSILIDQLRADMHKDYDSL